MTIFAPEDVNYDEIIKAMHPAYDMRYLRPTSTKGDKHVYYPATMHTNAENMK